MNEPKMTKELFKRLRIEELERMMVEDYMRPIILSNKDSAYEYGLLVLDARMKNKKEVSIHNKDYTIIYSEKTGVFIKHEPTKTHLEYDNNSLSFVDGNKRIIISIYIGQPYNNFWTTEYELYCEKVTQEYLTNLFAQVWKRIYDTIIGKEE